MADEAVEHACDEGVACADRAVRVKKEDWSVSYLSEKEKKAEREM